MQPVHSIRSYATKSRSLELSFGPEVDGWKASRLMPKRRCQMMLGDVKKAVAKMVSWHTKAKIAPQDQ